MKSKRKPSPTYTSRWIVIPALLIGVLIGVGLSHLPAQLSVASSVADDVVTDNSYQCPEEALFKTTEPMTQEQLDEYLGFTHPALDARLISYVIGGSYLVNVACTILEDNTYRVATIFQASRFIDEKSSRTEYTIDPLIIWLFTINPDEEISLASRAETLINSPYSWSFEASWIDLDHDGLPFLMLSDYSGGNRGRFVLEFFKLTSTDQLFTPEWSRRSAGWYYFIEDSDFDGNLEIASTDLWDIPQYYDYWGYYHTISYEYENGEFRLMRQRYIEEEIAELQSLMNYFNDPDLCSLIELNDYGKQTSGLQATIGKYLIYTIVSDTYETGWVNVQQGVNRIMETCEPSESLYAFVELMAEYRTSFDRRNENYNGNDSEL